MTQFVGHLGQVNRNTNMANFQLIQWKNQPNMSPNHHNIAPCEEIRLSELNGSVRI